MADFEIAALLQKTIGLKINSIGKPILNRAVLRRMKALSLTDVDVYADRLKSSAHELHFLIEEVVIPETWFFRDAAPFKAMTKHLINQWIPQNKDGLFKVLSVPCSTGEEPYSIAMTLLGSGWPAEKFTIHAVDISHRAIARAKEARYGEHSFRGGELAYRSRYFFKNPKHYTLKNQVRERVHFHTGNILNASFMKGLGIFDVIFSRNILIYFDSHSRKLAIDTLYNVLHDDGILIVGHAEANLLSSYPFAPAPFPQAFAFYKKPRQPAKPAVKKQAEIAKNIAENKIPQVKYLLPKQQEPQKKPPDLEMARKLADKGELRDAGLICRKYLDRYGPSPQAFFLLGIIHDAANDISGAEKFFRRALYLDPKHEEALIFLSLLTEKTGNIAETRTLKKRLERLQTETSARQHNNHTADDELNDEPGSYNADY